MVGEAGVKDASEQHNYSTKRIKRMTFRPNEKKFMIYPENSKKGPWDLSITLLLLLSSVMIPLQIAFANAGAEPTSSVTNFQLIMYVIDVLFLIDIMVTFNTAFYDDDNDLIDQRCTIAQSYLLGWFSIDLVAIIPFEVLLKVVQSQGSGEDLNPLIRIARFGKLYKLVKLIRLVRMLKIMKVMKNKNHVVKKLNKLMDLDLGFERLFFIFLIILMIIHISACLWIILATMTTDNDTNYSGTWLASFYADGMKDPKQLYKVAFYWATTTITTVGYGDISGTNNTERVFCAIIMLFGVIAFSFANGSMTSII